MMNVRVLLWTACAIAAGAWAGAVVAGRRAAATVVAPPAVALSDVVVEQAGPQPSPLPQDAATLRLRLVSDADGAPVAMRVRLWRLGLPADESGPARDEMWLALDVPVEGCVVPRLPAGRYRLQCLDARKDSDDPPEFDVAGGSNEQEARVPNRRTMRMRLRLVDEQGTLIRQAMRCRGGGASGWTRDEPDAPWANPVRRSELGGVAAGDAMPRKTGPVVSADDDGFLEVESRKEAPRHGYHRWTDLFRNERRATVVVSGFDDLTGAGWNFVGVAPTIRTLTAGVVRPDGRPLGLDSADVEAYCTAARFDSTPPSDAWRTISVHVKVTVAFLEPLTFDWTADTADAEHRLVLSPSPVRFPK